MENTMEERNSGKTVNPGDPIKRGKEWTARTVPDLEA